MTRRIVYWYVQLDSFERAYACLAGLVPYWKRIGPPDGHVPRAGPPVCS